MQTDIFSVFGIEDEVAIKKQKEEEEKKKRQEEVAKRLEEAKKSNENVPASAMKTPAKKEESQPFEVNFDTFIRHLGDNIAITEYFTTEELEDGIATNKKDKEEVEYKKITGEDVRKRMEKDYPDLVAAYTEMAYIKKNNMVIPVPKAKKKGLTDNNCTKELSNESSFGVQKIPFTLLRDFISLSKEYSDKYGVELHGDIYLNLSTREFFLDIPGQMASPYLVEPVEDALSFAMRMMDIPFKKVMEIHSV